MPALRIACRHSTDAFDLSAVISLPALPEFARAKVIHAGLAAVIEDESGRLSWWALTHGGTQPDFHDPATFKVQLPPR